MIKKVIFFLIVLNFFIVSVSFCQQDLYTDVALNNYMTLENSITEKINNGTIGYNNLEEVQEMIIAISDENRTDILNRLEMLSFIIESELDKRSNAENAEQILGKLSLNEEQLKNKENVNKSKKIIIWSAVGTSLVMSGLYTFSTIMANDYYDHYANTKTAEDAAFYLYSWPILDTISIISGITAIVSATVAGLTAAIY